MDWIRELAEFLWAVITNWAAYVTGSVIVALLWLWSTLRQIPISRKIGVVVALFFLFIAFFNAWREEERKAEDARRDIQTLRKQLQDLTQPKFEITHGDIRISDLIRNLQPDLARAMKHPEQDVKSTCVSFWVTVFNHGAPSVIKAIKLKAIPMAGNPVEGVSFHYQKPLTLPTIEGLTLDVASNEYLAVKGTANPIPTGGQADGLTMFLFPYGLREAFIQPSTKFILQIEDVTGKPYFDELVPNNFKAITNETKTQ